MGVLGGGGGAAPEGSVPGRGWGAAPDASVPGRVCVGGGTRGEGGGRHI